MSCFMALRGWGEGFILGNWRCPFQSGTFLKAREQTQAWPSRATETGWVHSCRLSSHHSLQSGSEAPEGSGRQAWLLLPSAAMMTSGHWLAMSWHSEPRVKSWLSACRSTGVFEEEPGADWEA